MSNSEYAVKKLKNKLWALAASAALVAGAGIACNIF